MKYCIINPDDSWQFVYLVVKDEPISITLNKIDTHENQQELSLK